jgi:glycosyltransferase involved in cell wall biosynthesis
MQFLRTTDLPLPEVPRSGWPWTEETASPAAVHTEWSKWPRISIVTPSYNQGGFIEETIRSVLLQGYPELEFIIIDGASSDQTVRIVRKYDKWIDFWVSEPDKGQSDAINKGFQRATGSIISWLNSDDFLAPGALQAIGVSFVDADENVGAVIGRGHKIDEDYRIFYSTCPSSVSFRALATLQMTFLQPSCFFRKSAWERFGPIRTDLSYCMDYAFWLAISQAYDFLVIDADIAFAHTHNTAKTTAGRKHFFAELALLAAQQPGGFENARQLLWDLVDGKVVPNAQGIRELSAELRRRIVRRFMRAMP